MDSSSSTALTVRTRDSSLVVAICTHSREKLLSRLLSTLRTQQWPAGSRLLVVDNDPAGSSSAAVAAAAADFPVPVDYVVEPSPGFATVRNAAVARLPEATTICFLDDDAVVPSDWLGCMWRASGLHPDSLIRSRYAFVTDVPDGPREVDRLTQALGPLERFGPAGTSGLLIPGEVLGRCGFDPYYDASGGEDLDLLLRFERAGLGSVLADTVVVEQERLSGMPLSSRLALARWNGRLSIVIRQRAGAPTLTFRVQAATTALSATVKWAAAEVLRRRVAAAGFRALAAGRWATATAPWRPPPVLGRRPTV
jgi:glycosyltransferase involved in cell wall biosynthesis